MTPTPGPRLSYDECAEIFVEWAWEWALEDIAKFAEEKGQQYYRVWDSGKHSLYDYKRYGYSLSDKHFAHDGSWGQLPNWHGAQVDLLVQFWGYVWEGDVGYGIQTKVFDVSYSTVHDGITKLQLFLNPWTCQPMGDSEDSVEFWYSANDERAIPQSEPRLVLEPTQ